MPENVKVEQLSTERLLLTPVTYADANDIFDLFTDKKVLKNYGIPPHKNLEESKKLIRLLTNHNHFSWGIRQKKQTGTSNWPLFITRLEQGRTTCRNRLHTCFALLGYGFYARGFP